MGLDRSMFSYRSTKKGKVLISWNAKIVMALKGAKVSKEETLGHNQGLLGRSRNPLI